MLRKAQIKKVDMQITCQPFPNIYYVLFLSDSVGSPDKTLVSLDALSRHEEKNGCHDRQTCIYRCVEGSYRCIDDKSVNGIERHPYHHQQYRQRAEAHLLFTILIHEDCQYRNHCRQDKCAEQWNDAKRISAVGSIYSPEIVDSAVGSHPFRRQSHDRIEQAHQHCNDGKQEINGLFTLYHNCNYSSTSFAGSRQ